MPASVAASRGRKKKKGAGANDLASYLVSYGNPKEFIEWLKQARSGPNLLLPRESAGMPIWDVFRGQVTQQRIWTFGSNLVDGSIVTSQEPLNIRDGVVFTTCAAGERLQRDNANRLLGEGHRMHRAGQVVSRSGPCNPCRPAPQRGRHQQRRAVRVGRQQPGPVGPGGALAAVGQPPCARCGSLAPRLRAR